MAVVHFVAAGIVLTLAQTIVQWHRQIYEITDTLNFQRADASSLLFVFCTGANQGIWGMDPQMTYFL